MARALGGSDNMHSPSKRVGGTGGQRWICETKRNKFLTSAVTLEILLGTRRLYLKKKIFQIVRLHYSKYKKMEN